MEASRWDECVDDRVVLKSVRRWCSKSLSSKEVSREIIRHPECTCWVSVVRDHPPIVERFTSRFQVPQPRHTYGSSSRRYHQRVVWHASSVAQTKEVLLLLYTQRGRRNGPAFDVFALHGVVPRFAVSLHPLFSEECPYNNFHVFRGPSRNACSSLSIAVGGARPYLRSDSFWLSASRMRSRFSGETMFSVILLMSALYVLSSLQKRTSSQICIGESGSSRAQQVAMPCAVLAPIAFSLCWTDLTRPKYAHTEWQDHVCVLSPLV